MHQSVFGTESRPTGAPEASRRDEGVIYRFFGTATLPTGTSVPSLRGETVIYRSFATTIMPTDASVASPRGEGGLLTGLRHGDPAHRCLGGILGEPL